jgi:aspartate oxidase
MRNHSSNSSSVFAQTGLAAALHEEDEDDFDADELCVVCWVGQRSVALVHGNDAHLVRKAVRQQQQQQQPCICVVTFVVAV